MNLVTRKTDPVMPTLPARNMAPMPSRVLHHAAQQAASDYSYALDEVDRLTEGNQILRADLDVERRANAELRRLLDAERDAKDRYMRYAIELRTHMTHVVDIVAKADACALDCAKQPQPDPPAQLDAIEAEIGKVIAEGVAVKDAGR